MLFDERGATHHHARRAEAALHRVVRDERRLNRVKLVALGQPFDGCDARSARVEREGHAAGSDLAVEPHRARRAGAAIATDLGTGQARLVAQDLDERGRGIDQDRDRPSVHVERHGRGLRSNRKRLDRGFFN